MAWAILAYLAALAVLVYCTLSFYRTGRIGGLAACVLIALQVYARPLLFLAGVDEPSPPDFFERDSWYLVAIGALVGGAWIGILTATYWVFYEAAPARGFFPRAPERVRLSHVFIAATALTALNLLATSIMVASVGGIARFQVAVKLEKALSGFYIVREMSGPALIICGFALFACGLMRDQIAPRLRKRMLAYIMVLITLNFGVYFAWGTRMNIALFAIAFLVGWHFAVRRISLARLAMITTIAATVLFQLRRLRASWKSDVVGVSNVTTDNIWREISQSLHFVEFDALMLALRDAGSRFDFTYGAEFLNGVLAWVPRFIFPEKKSFVIGGWFRQIYQPDIINGWPVTLPGAWYLNFNWFGIVIGAMVSGIIIAMLDKTYRAQNSAWSVAMVTTLGFTFVQGGVTFGFLQGYIMVVVPIFAIARMLSISHDLSNQRMAAGGQARPLLGPQRPHG